MSIMRQVFAIPLLMEEALFTCAFQRRASLCKCLQMFKIAYSQRQLERVIFDYTPIVVGSWKSRFKILEFKCLWNLE